MKKGAFACEVNIRRLPCLQMGKHVDTQSECRLRAGSSHARLHHPYPGEGSWCCTAASPLGARSVKCSAEHECRLCARGS